MRTRLAFPGDSHTDRGGQAPAVLGDETELVAYSADVRFDFALVEVDTKHVVADCCKTITSDFHRASLVKK